MRKQYPLDPRKQPYIEKPKQRIGTAREMKGVGIALFFHETAKIYSAKSSSDTVGVPIFGHCARLHSNTVLGQNSRNSLRQVFGAIVGWKAHNYAVRPSQYRNLILSSSLLYFNSDSMPLLFPGVASEL